MKQGPEYKGCRYWGYEPASAEDVHNAALERVERIEVKRRHNADSMKIKEMKLKPVVMGFKTSAAAAAAAQMVERAAKVEMRIFNHDFL